MEAIEIVGDGAERTQRDPDRSRGAEAAGEIELLPHERERGVPLFERGVREGGLRAPVHRGRVRLAHRLLAPSHLEQVGERGARVTLREPQPGTRVQQQRAAVGVADRLGRAVRFGGFERRLGSRELTALGERLYEHRGRSEHAQPAGVHVCRERGLRVGHGIAEPAGPEAGVRAEQQHRPHAVVRPVSAGLVYRRRENSVRFVEAVGDRQAADRERDHDRQDRIGPQPLDRPLRELCRPLRRLARHRELGRGDRELHRAVELAGLDPLAQPSGAIEGRATRAQGKARHAHHVSLDMHGQSGVRVGAGGERALDDLYRLRRVVHADHRRERARRVQPRDGVLRRLDAPPQVLDRRLAVQCERLRQPQLQ